MLAQHVFLDFFVTKFLVRMKKQWNFHRFVILCFICWTQSYLNIDVLDMVHYLFLAISITCK